MKVQLTLTLEEIQGRWVTKLRNEAGGFPYALSRIHGSRKAAEHWVLERAREELRDATTDDAA